MAVTARAPRAAAGAFEASRPQRSLWRDAMRRLMRNKMAIASAIIILLIMFMAIFASFLPLQDPINYMSRETDPGGGGTRLPPAWDAGGNTKFLLGTDASGRDVLSRIIFGAQVSFMVGFIPVSIVVSLGLLVGMTAGFLGGRVDNL